MNAKRAIKHNESNYPVRKSIRVRKAAVAKENLKEALRE